MKCPSCSKENFPRYEICQHCGSPLDVSQINKSQDTLSARVKSAAESPKASPESEEIKKELLNEARKQLISSDFENAARSAIGVLSLDEGNAEATAILRASEAALMGGDPSIEYDEDDDLDEGDGWQFNALNTVSTIIIVLIILSFFIPEVSDFWGMLGSGEFMLY
jgi:uncharacterized OB-fold protein